MGADRTIWKAAKAYCGKGYNTSYWDRVSSKWVWRKRCEDYDRHLDQIAQKATADQINDMVKRHLQLSLVFQNKIVERINTFEPSQLSPSDMIRWLETSVKLERLVRGLPTDQTKQESSSRVINDIDLSGLTDDELQQLEKIAARVNKSGNDSPRKE